LKIWKTLEKKNQTEILEIKSPFRQRKNTVEGHSSRLEQVEDRISELNNKVEIKDKTEEILVKKLKSCEQNMQELRDSIKRPNVRIMAIEVGEEVQAKGILNIFNNIVTESFPNLEKVLPIQLQEASRTPNRLDQNRTSPWYIIIKTTRTRNRERTLKAVGEKKQIMYKGKPIKVTVDFSLKTLKVRRSWSEVFQELNDKNVSPRILYPAKLSFKIQGAIKIFHISRN
jgi:chromosome segregation ATPase